MRRMVRVPAVGLLVAAVGLSGCETIRKLHGKPVVERRGPWSAAAQGSPGAELEAPGRIVAPGIVEPWGGEVDASPIESGWLARVLVQEGQHVEAGQVLAVLDDEAQSAAVELARAELAEAQAAVAKATHGSTAEELREARADAEAADARAAFAQEDAARAARLGREAAIPPATVDRAAAEARAALASARGNAARVAELERGARSEDRAALADRLLAAKARLDLAAANLARRRVVAQSASTVLLSRSHAGEYFGVGGSPLFVLGDASKLQVRLEVDEVDAFAVEPGAVCLLFGDDEARIAEGRVVRLAPRMGRRGLAVEAPTARADVRVREVFVEVGDADGLVPGRRVWGHIAPLTSAARPRTAR